MSARAKYLIMSLGAIALGITLAFATMNASPAGHPVQTAAPHSSSQR